MKNAQTSLIAVGACIVCIAVFVAQAQFGSQPAVSPIPGARPAAAGAAASAEGQVVVRNNGLTDLSKDYAQRASSLSQQRSGGKQKNWGVFDVTFDTAPEWIDNLSITYMVMLENERAKQGEKRMSLYTATFDYADIPGGPLGRDHKAGVLLPPNTLLRYGKPIGFAVIFAVNGQPAGDRGDGIGSLKGQNKWWMNDAITGSEFVQKRTGLIERSKSPFASAEIDSYEIAK